MKRTDIGSPFLWIVKFMRWNDSCPAFLMKDFNVVNQAWIAIFDLSFTERYVKPKVRDSSVFAHLWSMYVYQCCLSGVMSDEKKTSRHGYFVSIHNCLYTQCIGAPIKKTSFFSSFFLSKHFFRHFLKSHRFFFSISTESKESSVHEQATTEFLIVSCRV